MRELHLYSEDKNLLSIRPSFPGLTSSFKTAREHHGYAVVASEKTISRPQGIYVWELVFYHNGDIVGNVSGIKGELVDDTISQKLSEL